MKYRIPIPATVIACLATLLTNPVEAEEVRIDHILWATPDIANGAEQFEALSGVRPVFGGVHPGRGTANHLAALGPHTYLEIIGPNPGAPHESEPRVEIMRTMTSPAIFTFAVSTTDLEAMAAAATELGIATKGPAPGERAKADGKTLRWRSLTLIEHDFGNAIPFGIDWGMSDHPATTSPAGAELISLAINHPRAEELQRIYSALGIPVHVAQSGTAEFIARIKTPRGEVELRGEVLD